MTEKLLRKKFTFKDSRWQYRIIFQGDKPIGVACGVDANQAIGAYLSQQQDLPREEIGVNVDGEKYSAEPVGKDKKEAMNKFLELLIPEKKRRRIIIQSFTVNIPRKPKQFKIPGLPPVHNDA
ncbi:MAG: hypothetical protein V1684_02060 [bacterium]